MQEQYIQYNVMYLHHGDELLTPKRVESPPERCESGRIGLTANELTGETWSEGSNPSLSAA